MDEGNSVYADKELLPIATKARVVPLDFGKAAINVTWKNKAMMAVAELLRHSGIYPVEALVEAVRLGQRPEFAQENVAAIEGSRGLISI